MNYNNLIRKMFNLDSVEATKQADKEGKIESQLNSIEGMEIKTKEEFNGKEFKKKAMLTFGKINLNVW